MHIELDELTTRKLELNLAEKPGVFKLFVDTEGCGCNGVIVIRIVSRPDDTDIRIQTEPFTFYVDRQQESLFDEKMRLKADVDYPSFKLTSDSNLLGNHIRIQDLRD
ncbi:iron-sulfur cluster biosynthesis family protein [Paenibacillus albidus]|uniref:iron-sulfur cluster biosynthesis family protein n=1 Tax=Paenibacillus albidus TaxID=2041023 RepID=UPI001BE8E86E|nr:iron-sulfur cluster biosynthesis family protein [Paenibacillus albidus]MBT2288899.1 iron-sulfur cluster biosynthesis family protein [Paenibacillus albidus]